MGLGVAVVGIVVLVAWALQATERVGIGPSDLPTMPTTALALALGGGALALVGGGAVQGVHRAAVLAASGIVAGVGGATVVSYVAAPLLGLPVPPSGIGWAGLAAWRPAFVTGIALLLAGAALAAAAIAGQAAHRARCAVSLALAGFAYLLGLAHLFGAPDLLALLGPGAVAVPTVLGLLGLGVGLLLAEPGCPWLAIIASPGPGGEAARRLLPFALLGPIAIGWLRLAGEKAGLYSPEVGVSVVMFAFSGGAIALVSWGALGMEAAWQAAAAHERATDEALRREASLLDNLPMLVGLKDVEGRYTFVNQEFERVTGTPREALLGRTAAALGRPDLQARTEAMDAEVLASGRAMVYEEEVPGPDGSRTFWVMRFPLLNIVHTPIGIVTLSQDVTERVKLLRDKEAREAELGQMRRVQAMKDHFLSTVSHELKTPLAIINGSAELLEERFPHEPLFAALQEGVQRLDAHIGRLLDLTALVGDAMPLYQSEIDLEELFQAVADETTPTLFEAGMQLETAVAAGLPALVGDQRRLTQLLSELVGNAARHAREGDRVYLGAVARGDAELALAVCDDGPGIAPEVLGEMWAAFGQTDLGDARLRGGLGIGLALAQLLAQAHGGRIEPVCIEAGHPSPACRASHHGCCFQVVLPARPAPSAMAPPV